MTKFTFIRLFLSRAGFREHGRGLRAGVQGKGVQVVPASECFEFEDEEGHGEEIAEAAAVANIAHKMATKEHKRHSSVEKENAESEATADAPVAPPA